MSSPIFLIGDNAAELPSLRDRAVRPKALFRRGQTEAWAAQMPLHGVAASWLAGSPHCHRAIPQTKGQACVENRIQACHADDRQCGEVLPDKHSARGIDGKRKETLGSPPTTLVSVAKDHPARRAGHVRSGYRLWVRYRAWGSKGRRRLLPSAMAVSKRTLGISLVVEWT